MHVFSHQYLPPKRGNGSKICRKSRRSLCNLYHPTRRYRNGLHPSTIANYSLIFTPPRVQYTFKYCFPAIHILFRDPSLFFLSIPVHIFIPALVAVRFIQVNKYTKKIGKRNDGCECREGVQSVEYVLEECHRVVK